MWVQSDSVFDRHQVEDLADLLGGPGDHADPAGGDVRVEELDLETEALQHRFLGDRLPGVDRRRGMQVGDGLADMGDPLNVTVRRVVAPLTVAARHTEIGRQLGITLGAVGDITVRDGIDLARCGWIRFGLASRLIAHPMRITARPSALRQAQGALGTAGVAPSSGPGMDARADRTGIGRPARGCLLGGGLGGARGPGSQHRHHSRDLLGCRVAADHPQIWLGHGVRFGHSGMFPCFLGGRVSRLVRSKRSTRVISTRVSCGLITAST